MQAIRLYIFLEATAFTVAALAHFGLLIGGYEHLKAGIAESVIAVALLAGLALTWIRPDATRKIALATQTFALLGTLVGILRSPSASVLAQPPTLPTASSLFQYWC